MDKLMLANPRASWKQGDGVVLGRNEILITAPTVKIIRKRCLMQLECLL
jgi:SepF-like predicted cell division protein (DUF552 family)